MRARFTRTKASGQSLPLIALMIVVLIGMVGLSVDVGNNYARQRNAVRATNAAAIAGMTAIIQGGSDKTAGNVIQQSLRSNDVNGVYDTTSSQPQSGQDTITALYLDSKGNPLLNCNIGSCGTVPTGVTYIQVKVDGLVDTYFARVLDRPTLPLHAQAFAGRCTPVQGVYPIGVQASYLDKKGFVPPTDHPATAPYYTTYTGDPNYPKGLTQRRVYMKHDANSPGDFDWLRWQAVTSTGNSPGLISMLSGGGNLSAGFDEGFYDAKTGAFTWPDKNTQAPMSNGKAIYPVKPHEFNTGDWIYANTGVQISSSVETALRAHIDQHNVMYLPIVGPAVGTGVNATFPVVGLGAFYLVGIPGYGTGADAKGGGANGFFDLVYIAPANSIACLSTPAVVSKTLGVSGAVFVKPSWKVPQQVQLPIAYEIIMDVSGSMSWNFAGQGSSGGSTLQCEPTVANPTAVSCGNGGDTPWKTTSERRIHVVKNALAGSGGFIDNMKPIDTMRVIAFSTDGVTSSGWSSTKSELKTTVMDAGMYKNDPYLTSGATNGADAIQKAYQVLASDPPPSNGQPYKHVVIYMTDGVSNVFLSSANGGSRILNYARDICPQFNGDDRALNNPNCQFDDVDDAHYTPSRYGQRPISAMITQANNLRRAYDDMQLFVVALANVNPLGLDQVAGSSDALLLASQSNVVDTVLDQIRTRATDSCSQTVGTLISHIDAAHTASFTNGPNLPTGIYGYAYLYDQSMAPVKVPWTGSGADPRGAAQNAIPITQDGLDGNLGYQIPTSNGLAPGLYRMKAFVNYRAAAPEGDGISRQYDALRSGLNIVPDVSFTLTPDQVLGSSVVLNPLRLELPKTVKLCP